MQSKRAKMAATDIPMADGELRYWRSFVAPDEAAHLNRALQADLPWIQHEVRIAGRVIPAPRLSSWHGDRGITYGYSGARYTATGWPPALSLLRSQIESVTGLRFNSVLANLYRHGQDSMGWHADREPELGANPAIASVSFGAARKFVLKHRRKKAVSRVDLWLESGSLLLMLPPTQANWRHALPKTQKPVAPRVNLTFRFVVD